MKKHCGCSDYDKCEHEIAEAGATPKEAESKDGEQEKVDVEKKDRCWDGYEPVPGKKPYEKGSCAPVKKHEEVIEDIMKSWDGPEAPCTCGADGLNKAEKPFKGYNPEKHAKTGGLNDKYREKYNRENGSNLQRPSKDKDNPRHKSFCARMKGVKGPTSEGGELTPKGAALERWACSKSDLGKSYSQIKKEESKPSLNGPKKEPSEPMKRLKPGVSPEGMPVLSGSAKDIADVLRHHSGMPKQMPAPKKDPFMEEVKRFGKEYAEKHPFRKNEEPENTKVDTYNQLKAQETKKPDLSLWHDPETSPSGKKYKDMEPRELHNHMLNVWADMSDQFRTKPLNRPESIKIDGQKASGEKDKMEKGEPKKLSAVPKTPMGHGLNGKKYEDMSMDELSSHVDGLFAEKPKAESKPKGPKGPGPLAASEAGKEAMGETNKKPKDSEWEDSEVGKEYKPSWSKKKELDKADIIDMKTKAKTAGTKPAAKKPDTRSRDQKIKDALASQGEKGSPYAATRPSVSAAPTKTESKPSAPAKPGIHAGMSRQELMDQVNRSPSPSGFADGANKIKDKLNGIDQKMKQLKQDGEKLSGKASAKPSSPGLKVIKSLEALAPSLDKGMSMAELKKAEEQYSALVSKVESLLAKGDVDAIKSVLEKIKGNK